MKKLIAVLVLVVCAVAFAKEPIAGGRFERVPVEHTAPVYFEAPVFVNDTMDIKSGVALNVDAITEKTAATGVTVDSVVLKDGGITTTGTTIKTPTALTVTNGQAITVSAGCYILTGAGQADNFTNTVTVANGTAGTEVTFIVSDYSSNLVNFADSTNLRLSGAALLDNSDTLSLMAATSTNWVETAQQDN